MTDTGLLTWLLLIPAAAAAAADLRVESEADRLPPVLARVGQHSPVLSLPPNTHTRFGATVLLGIILFVCLWPNTPPTFSFAQHTHNTPGQSRLNTQCFASSKKIL